MSEKFFDRKSWENSIGPSNSNNWLFFSRTNCIIINLLCTLWYCCSIFSVESLIFAIASVIGPFFIIFYFIMCITKVLIDEM